MINKIIKTKCGCAWKNIFIGKSICVLIGWRWRSLLNNWVSLVVFNIPLDGIRYLMFVDIVGLPTLGTCRRSLYLILFFMYIYIFFLEKGLNVAICKVDLKLEKQKKSWKAQKLKATKFLTKLGWRKHACSGIHKSRDYLCSEIRIIVDIQTPLRSQFWREFKDANMLGLKL